MTHNIGLDLTAKTRPQVNPHRYAGSKALLSESGLPSGSGIAEPDGSARKEQSVSSKPALSRCTSVPADLALPVFSGGIPGQGVVECFGV